MQAVPGWRSVLPMRMQTISRLMVVVCPPVVVSHLPGNRRRRRLRKQFPKNSNSSRNYCYKTGRLKLILNFTCKILLCCWLLSGVPAKNGEGNEAESGFAGRKAAPGGAARAGTNGKNGDSTHVSGRNFACREPKLGRQPSSVGLSPCCEFALVALVQNPLLIGVFPSPKRCSL